jgi:serine/threonine-protein kinase
MNFLEKLQTSLSDRYRIEREIGVGGMATVYLAKDLRHDRDVALKLLKPELGAVLGPERFLSEIRVTAKLQHPNLLPLFDSGEADGQLWYAMPYVEGESLRAKMERERQISVRESVRIAVLVAGALDYAHRHGVIHRDLKPENILLHEGQPLVADFGIALAVSNAGGERVTQTGLSLGTPQYMSPEQATGERGVDARTDIYSLGAVLYEMLTGEAPHTGATVQAIIARLMTDTPRSVRSSRPSVPENVEWAIQKALEKVPADRFETAKEFAETLEGQRPITSSRTVDADADRRILDGGRRKGEATAIPWIVAGTAAALALMAIGYAWYAKNRSGVEAEPTRFVMQPTGAERIATTTMAISPDGREIVYGGFIDQDSKLYKRRLDEVEAHEIPGTDGAVFPVYSPDGKWIAFYSGGDLRRVPSTGGSPLTIASGLIALPYTWTVSGDVVLQTRAITRARSGLSRVPATGGTPTAFLASDTAKFENLGSPREANGDGTLLFRAEGPGGIEDDFLAIGKLGDKTFVNLKFPATKILGYVDGNAIILRSEQQKASILALPLDLKARKITGDPIPLIDGVASNSAAAFSGGTLAYESGTNTSRLLMLDFSGKADTVVAEQRDYVAQQISPDGKNIAFSVTAAAAWDLWVYNIAAKTTTRLVTNGVGAQWTADSKNIVYIRATTAGAGLWRIPADGSGQETQLKVKLPAGVAPPAGPFSINGDGSLIVFMSSAGAAKQNIYWFKPGVDDVAHPWMATEFNELLPKLSPDGKWVAYVSDEAGATPLLFVRPFPGPGARVQISVAGANAPSEWSDDGRVLYYRSGLQLMAADVSAGAGGFVVNARRTVMPIPALWDIAPDGKHVLVAKSSADESKVIVVETWLTEVRRKLREAKR